VILASQNVGSQGRVVGIDGAEKMIDRAREAVAEAGLENSNIEFRVGDALTRMRSTKKPFLSC